MKLAFVASSGSPTGITPPDLYGRGVGGAEIALISLTETLAARGHSITVFNNPSHPAVYDGVRYDFIHHFDESKLDAVILFRNPWENLKSLSLPVIFWSCDQQTEGDYNRDIFPFVTHSICISPYHRMYHIRRYGVDPEKISYIDLGVRLQDYKADVEKIKGRCIYCSQPDRGLTLLLWMWPKIKQEVPEASLVITADRRLWGVPYAGDERYRTQWQQVGGKQLDINYLGRVGREELCEEQLKAELMTFPCTYEELFCVSAAECQVAGAIPVTSIMGALRTTVEAGVKVDYPTMSPDFVTEFLEATIDLLKSSVRQEEIREEARKTRSRFDWHRIAGEWETLIGSLS
ncbi:MAG: glycosyltransferase family 4 protein [Candidatus Thorarchaeota archaeon]|jgi:glycosyltransferase involved in cell wall biosynthesis